MSYSLVSISDSTIIASGLSLPDELAGLDDTSVADVSWIGAPLDEIYFGKGYWPEIETDPVFDEATEVLDAPIVRTPDPSGRIVYVARTVRALTAEEMEPRRAQRRDAVMIKREQVIDGGFTFGGTVFQTGATDRENISGAAQLAFMAMVGSGKQPGDLRWHDGDDDFGWIALDNSVVPMDAPTVIEFAKAVAGFKSYCIRYARYLKDMIDAAENPASIDIEAGWPS